MPHGSKTLSGDLARFLNGLSWDDIPDPIRVASKLRVLDILGVILAAQEVDGAQAMRSVMSGWKGNGEARVIGEPPGHPAATAALMNGYLAHALDFDDTHHESRVHPSAVVVTTALAAGEAVGASGKDAVAAVVAGLEVMIRLGLAAPGRFHERGWHATSVCGAVAAAAVAGRVYRLDVAQLINTLGIATSTASGLREAYLGEATNTKAFHAGWAAHSGIVAAELGRAGFTGPSTALEGRFGYLNAFLSPDPWDLESQTRTLGAVWLSPGITYKLFPCGSLTHACIDAALDIRRGDSFDPAEIAEVVCIVPTGMVSTICEPTVTKLNPRSGYEAKFSVQYAVAAALLHGRVTENQFRSDALTDPALRGILARVQYEADPALEFPAKYPGAVRVTMKSGAVTESTRANSPGTVDRPIGDDEIVDKFRFNAEPLLGAARTSEVVDRVLHLDAETRLAPVLDLCSVR
jgi:2-methylcitrate dehydratase PrpD